ncbi:hypothetical protein [Arenimonas sp. MALMAid1274]|uniref:hypothetical protein n=1 Tax=Arenimonas sp. MALMAid1274 TaxID=3411630 RepID=UPI003BA20391
MISDDDSCRETFEFEPRPVDCHEVRDPRFPRPAPSPLLAAWTFCRPARPDPCGAGDPAWLDFLGVPLPDDLPEPLASLDFPAPRFPD